MGPQRERREDRLRSRLERYRPDWWSLRSVGYWMVALSVLGLSAVLYLLAITGLEAWGIKLSLVTCSAGATAIGLLAFRDSRARR